MTMLAYRLATRMASPLLGLVLQARVRDGKEDPTRLNERRAIELPARPGGPLVWLHGASVGETQILFELGQRLLQARPDLNLLFTSQTLTSANLIAPRLDPRARHAMAPVDTPGAANRFISHWRPDLAVFGEGELWPNLIHSAKAQGTRLALINARMTAESARGWQRFRGLFRSMSSAFDVMLAADPETAQRISDLSGQTISLAGNLKSAARPPSAAPSLISDLRANFIAGRRCLVAASTHEPEESLFLDAAVDLADTALIIAPRHPARGEAIAKQIRARGVSLAQRSRGETADASTRVLLADTMGEMGLWFALADAVYLGGGHAEGVGGHNPLEPLRFTKPIISGPGVFNFASVMTDLQDRDLVTIARTPEHLKTALTRPSKPDSQEIEHYFENADAPMTLTLSALLPLLPAREAMA